MLLACWSAKGGSGTTVIASALAVLVSRSAPGGALIVDLAGDVDAALGVNNMSGRLGVSDWLRSDGAAVETLRDLEVDVDGALRLLGAGTCAIRDSDLGAAERASTLAAHLSRDPRPVIVDCGSSIGSKGGALLAAAAIAAAASSSLLVIRPCFLAVQRAIAAPIRPSGIVLVHEPGRSLGRADIESVLQAPIRAEVDVDPAVARSIDAGLLSSRVPRALARGLRHAA